MNAPIGLAIHTSSPDLGLALGSSDTIRHNVWDFGRDLTTYFHETLLDFVAPCSFQDFAFIAVAKGPGSFTGTRMGMTVARTIAQQMNIPLFGVSSLGAIAMTSDPQLSSRVAVQLSAQRGEVHGGIYAAPFNWAEEIDRVLKRETWDEEVQSIQANPLTPLVLLDAPVHQGSFVQAILTIAHQAYAQSARPEWWSVTPTYGQHPVPGH